MNCEDFRERLLRRPDEIDEAMGEHMAVCRGCAGMAEQIGAMDGVLREALAVEVPDNLGQTAVLQKMLARRRPRPWPLLALAATVLIGVGLAAGLWLGRAGGSELPAELIAHIEHEPYLLEPSVEIVPIDRVRRVLSVADVRLSDDIGSVRHIGLCEFRGHQVPHLVVHTDRGPVTVMLLPHERSGRIESFDEGGFRGVILPSGEGSIAIIGGPSSPLEDVRERFDRAVDFSI